MSIIGAEPRVGGRGGCADPALAAGATLAVAAPATAEPITYVPTSYIYPHTSSGLSACKAYGPSAQRQYHGVSYQCRSVTIGSLSKYRIYVGTK